MYANFIYFILVLLIYTTYYPPEKPYVGSLGTACLFGLGVVFLVLTSKLTFGVLYRRMAQRGALALHGEFDHRFNRQAVLAIIVFAIDIYALNLQLFLMKIPWLAASPTLMGLLVVGLFGGYLCILWAVAYRPYRLLFQTQLSRRSYVLSNVSYSLPVILPWLAISAFEDIIRILPFALPKRILATPEGQVIFFSGFLIALVVIAPSLIKFFWGCKPLPQGPERSRIETMCEKAKMKYNNILIWPIFEGKLLTAGVMGLIKRFRYILVTNSLLRILNGDEMDAVMAHEIGHIKRKHLVFYLIFFLGFIVVSYAALDLIVYGILYTNVFFPIGREIKFEQPGITSILLTVTMAGILLIYFRYVFGYFMRNCERQADLYAFNLLGSSAGLISSLEKIAVYSGKSHDRPSWHHFSIRQRIDFLNRCEADRQVIARHDRKLRLSILIFTGVLFCVGYVGYGLNFGEMGNTLNKRFLKTALTRELERNPKDARLYSMLGSIYYQDKTYGEAIEAYERSLELEPDNPEILNNLAWLYATCEENRWREPVKALVYAIHAAALKPVPHILDTLAESYYVNGLYEKAIVTIRRALRIETGDKIYFETQLRKFEKAAGRGNKNGL